MKKDHICAFDTIALWKNTAHCTIALLSYIYYNEAMTKSSAAKIAANRRYTEKAYKRYSVYIRKEDAPILERAAAESGQSVNGFINEAIRDKIGNG